MRVSLIIATRNRLEDLSRCLHSLSVQTVSPYEVIVVDQSDKVSADGTKSVCQHYGFHYIQDPNTGLSRARNLGLAVASGDIIGFPDDDCMYQPDTLEWITRWFHENRSFDGLCLSYSETRKVDPRRFPTADTVLTVANFWSRHCSVGLFVKKHVIDAVGTFDASFGAGTGWYVGEETDYILRALLKGLRLFYSARFVIYHRMRLLNREELTNIARSAYAHGALLGKHVRDHPPFWVRLAWRLGRSCIRDVTRFRGGLVITKATFTGFLAGYVRRKV